MVAKIIVILTILVGMYKIFDIVRDDDSSIELGVNQKEAAYQKRKDWEARCTSASRQRDYHD